MDHVSHLDISDDSKATLIIAGIEVMQRSKVDWTEAEVAILRENYPTGGASRCAELLPQRTIGAIGVKARTMRLAKPPFKPHRSPYFSTPHIDAAIRRYYQGTPRRGGLSKLAHQLARPVAWVSNRADHLGIRTPRFDAAKWSEREIEILRTNAWRIPSAIVRILRKNGFTRNANGVNIKLNRMRCDRSNDDVYSAIGLAGLFGVDKTVTMNWINRGLLKAQRRGADHPNDGYYIHHSAVRRFVVENASAVDIRRVDKIWFIDLLAETAR